MNKMTLCVSVSWFKKIGWLVLVFNLLLWAGYVNAQNLPPVPELGISNQHAEVGSAFSYTIPVNAFKDQNYDQLTYTTGALPAWLSFNSTTRTFSGTPGSTGNATINVTASDGSLNGSISFRITIHESGTYAAFTSNTQIGCNFRQVNFQNKSKGASSYYWDFGNGNTSTDVNPQAIYNTPDSYVVSLTINGDPALKHTEIITINSLPSPQIDTDITTGCEPLNTQLNYGGSARGGSPVYYHWYFFEKQPEQFTFSPSVNLNGLVGGDYNAILRVTDVNGCSGSTVFNKLFHVYEKPQTSFTYVKSNNCAPSVTTFTDKSELYDGNVSDYYWSVNGTNLPDNLPVISYDFALLGPGKHVVQLQTRSEHGCLSDVYTDTVYFNSSNTADFSINSAYCLNDTLELAAVASSGATNFSWDFGNNGSIDATENSFSKALAEPGTFPVKLAVDFNDGCRIESIKDVNIDRVNADFDFSSQYNCTSKVFTVSLNNTSASFLNKNISSLRWYLVNLSGSTLIGTNSSFQYTFNAEGTYTIRLDVVNEEGCVGSIAKSIQLNEPQAEISIDGNAYGCLSADAINFSANFSSQFDNAVSYSWDFGDSGNANGQNVSHTYSTPGSFDVSVTVVTNTGCSYTTTQLNAVQLANQPLVNSMVAVQPPGECFGSGLQLDVDYSLGVDLLSFNTPSGIENIDAPGASPYSYQYQFQHAGIYDFSVVASQYGCESETFTITGIEANEPEAIFTPSQTSFCENPPYIVTFDNNSVFSDPATTFSWDFGDGETSTDFEPQHEFTETGNFNVTLTVSNPNTGCSDQHSVQLNVYSFDDATGIISADVTEGCAPLTVLLSQNISTRLSSNYQIDQLMWDFDNNGVIDSITSSSAPISFTYSKPGLYAVRLIATSVNGGCDYEFVENGLIKASGPTVNFSHSPLMVCKNTNVQFNSSVSKPSFDTANPALNVYSWDFGDGGNSNIEIPEHTYTEESNFSVSLKVTDENNCSTIVVKPDLIKIIPFEVGFDLADSIICNNSNIQITNTSTGEISSFLWDFNNDGTTDLTTYNTELVTHNFVTAGNYTISLTAEVADGCTKISTKNIRVINADADFTALSQNIGCAPGFAYFEAVADPNDVESYAWSFGNGNTSNESSPRNYYVIPKSYTVSLTINFKGACQKRVIKPNYITAAGASGNFNFDKILGCAPNPVLFSVSKMSSVNYINWDFGDGNVKRDTVPGSVNYFETTYRYDTTGFRYPRVILTDEVCGDYTYINPDSIYTSLAPIPNFTTNYDSICRGVPIQFTDQTVSVDPLYDVTAWKWHFGTTSLDSSSTQNPLFAYKNMGVYSPQLIVYNALGCSDTLTKKSSIHIYGNADLSADFEIGPSDRDTLACAWQNVNFYSKANAGNGTISDYKWDFGTALKTGENSQFAFADSLKGNNVTVTHIVIDDKLCIDSTSRTVAINNLQAAFGYDPQPVFRGSAVDFTDQSVPHSGQSISNWSWNFGNGQPISSPVQNPQNIAYNNIVDDNTVRLIVTDDRSCTDTTTVLFNVLNNPPILEPFTITLVENSNYIFRRADFESRFDADDPGQSITAIRVETAPGRGYFRLNGSIYTVGTTIPIAQAALLEYVPAANWFGNTDFIWNAFDGYSWSDNPELVNVIVLEIPDPPTLNDIVIDLPEDQVAKVGRQLFIDNIISVLGSSFDFDSLQILSAINPSAIGELFFNSNPFNGPYPYLILADQIDDASAVFEYYPENGFNGTLSFQWNAHDGYNFAVSPARVIFNYINTAPELSNIELNDLSEDELVLLSNSVFLDHYSDIDQYDTPQTFYLSNLPPATEGVFMFGGQVISSDFELPFDQLNQLRFKPALGFEGTTQATWKVSDGDDTGEALIILHYKNAIPVVHDFTVNGYEDVTFTFSLSDFDKSPDINIPFEDEDYFDRLQTLRIVALPKHGQLTFNGLPVFADLEIPRNQISQLEYLSDFDWNGTDTLIYTAFDGTDWASNQAAVFIELAPVNDVPRPMADYYFILEDQTLSGVNVGINDNDVDNDHASLRYHVEPLDSASAGQNGTISLNQNGELTFVPDNDFNGWAYFIYTVCDPIGACARDTVYITVAPTNDAPLAIPDTFELFENELVSYFNTLLNDSDIDGDNFYMNAVNGSDVREFSTNYGTVLWNTDGSVEFTMPQSVDSLKAGQSVSVRVEYSIIDDSMATATSYFVILIKGLNNPPVAVDDVFEAAEGFNSIASSTLPYQNVLFNDYDIEGDPISVQLVNNSTLNSIVTRYGTFNWETTGEWVFVENQTVVDSLKQGEVVSVVLPYFITDTYVLSEQPANITFNISGVNDAPVAVNDTLVIFEDAGEVIISTNQPEALLSNDSDIDGDDINVERIGFNFSGMLSSDVGTLQWNSDGSYVYIPKRDSVIKLADGEIIYDKFKYTITDNFNGRDSAKLVVVIQGINDAPLAVDDSITIFEDTHITFVEEQFGLLSNDGDIDRDPIIVAVNDQNNFSSNGRYGRLTWQPNGAFEYETFIEIVDSLYQGQEVIDEFTYTIVDPLGLTDRASLFITIIGQNDAPVANDFSIATREKAPLLTISTRSEGILSNDTDIDDGTEFGIVDIENDQSGNVDGKYGSLQWNYDGTFVYNLNEAMDSLMLNEVVVDSFSYTIQDRFDSLAFAWFIIEITGDNDAPIALSDTLQLSEDDITLLPNWSLLDNDYDTDGDSLFMTAMNGNPISPVSTRFAMFDWTAQGNFTYKRYEYGNKRIELDTLAWDDLIIDSIAYNIADTNGVQSMAFLYLEIEGVNDAPFTKSDANYINENSTSISSSSNSHILSNDFDVDRGDSVMLMNIEGDISGLVIGKYGQLEWQPNGHYTFFNNFDAVDTLAQSERAYDIYRYTVSDRQGALTVDSLVITIIGANDRPVAVNDSILIYEDKGFVDIYPDSNGLLWNDYDVDGDSIYISLDENTVLIDGKYGSLSISATGDATYTLNNEIDSLASNQNVKDIFDYTLFDVLGSSSKAKVIINIVGNNDLPVVPDVFVKTDEDFDSIVATIDSEYALLFAASDIDGDTLNVIGVNDSTGSFVQGVYGNLIWQNNGSYVFENNLLTTQPLMQGDTVYEQFTFVVADPFEGFDTAIFTIEILGLNDAPWASPDFYETIENNRVALASSMPDHILYNDIDIDGDDFEIINVNQYTSKSVNGEYGRLNWQPDGSFEYLPDTLIAMALRPGETLTEVFVYQVEDIYNAADTSTVNITIVGINNPPVVINDTLEIRGKNLIATLDHSLLFNATDPDKDTLKVVRLESDTTGLYNHENYGQVVWSFDGYLQYSTDSIFFKELGSTQKDSKPYRFAIIDEAGEIGFADIIVMFYGENDPPVANNDTISIQEDAYAVVNVVANDFDIDYQGKGNIDLSTLLIMNSPKNGKAHVNTATGEIYFFPNENFNGIDSLYYEISDTDGDFDQAWLFIEVKPVNDPPRARHLVISTPLNTPVSFNAFYQVEDVDDGVDPLSGELVDMPASGTVEWPADSLITYTPDLDFTGVDEFTYSLADYQGENAFVIVNVIVPDDRFGAQNDTVITQENKAVDINVLVNDTLNGFEPSPNLLSIKVFPINGTAGYNPFTRNITYQPNQNFHGVDSLVYIVGSKTENWDFATLYIRVEPVNRPLLANNDAVTTFINAPVQIRILQNDYDYDDGIDTSSVRILVQPQNSKTDIQFDYNTGYAYYTPVDEHKGYDSFTYLVCDLNTDMPSCDTATVEILVRSRHEDFIAQNDYYPIEEGQTVLLNNPHPINNDGKEQNMPLLESFTIITSPQFGDYSLIETNKVISYTPNENYFGPDWIDYRVCDSNNNCDFAQINIWVEPVNNAPVAIDDSYVVNENVEKRFYVLANDYDVDGTLNFASLDTIAGEGPRKGELIIDRNTGTMLYIPQINSDVDRFKYRICDNEGKCSEATVMVIVDLGNTILHYQTVIEDVPDTFSVKPPMAAYNLFFDIVDTLEIMAPEMGAWDMIFDNIDPRIVYNPMHDSTGNDYYNVVLYAENGDSVDLRVYVEIIPVNDAPVAMPDTIVWNEPSDSTIVHYLQLLNNDFDVDGDQLLLTEAIINTSDSFSFAWNADSTFTIFSDSINWCEAWFYYQIFDADGETAEAMVWITPVLSGLIAENDTVSVDENSGNNQFDVLLNDSIKDNQRCTIDSLYIITMPVNGIADVSSDKMVLYRSTETYYGSDSLQYIIVDIWGQTDSAWVYIEVLQRNNPPVAVADVVENDFDQVLIITALDNDYDPDPDGYIDTIRTHVNIDEQPIYGTVVYSPDSGWFVYTPFELICEGDQFSYTIYDNEGDSASATVSIQLPAEANIVAVTDTVKTWPGVPKDFNVLQNDFGFFLPYVENFTQPQIGSVDQIGDSTFTYYSNPETMEKDSMTYELISPCGNFVVGKVIFVIEELRVPEIITPNGDGKNDVLIIDGIEYFPESMLRIYNRYGHVVYVKRGYMNDWDGHSNQGSLGGDKPLPSGTYYYTLEYNEGRNKQSGIIYIFN